MGDVATANKDAFMSGQQREEEKADGLDENLVADFLRDNPEFFLRHRRLAADLQIPHDVAPAISLIEYQVALLREDKRRLRWRLDDLLRVARDNDRVAEHMHRLTMELLEHEGLEATLSALRAGLQTDFRADVVAVRLFRDDLPDLSVEALPEDDPVVARFTELFRGHRPVVGRLTEEQIQLAFGEQAEGIRSAAVIPFTDGPLRGVVAIGSLDGERFRGDQGTVFLARLGDLCARMLRRALEADIG